MYFAKPVVKRVFALKKAEKSDILVASKTYFGKHYEKNIHFFLVNFYFYISFVFKDLLFLWGGFF